MSVQEEVIDKVIIEDSYEGKRNAGRVTVFSDKQSTIDHLEQAFRSQGFEVRYISDSTIYAERYFEMDKLFQKLGTIQLTVFEYSDHIVVYYEIHRELGLSFVTMMITLLYFTMGGLWLAQHDGDFNFLKGVVPALILASILFYQLFLPLRYFRKMVRGIFEELR